MANILSQKGYNGNNLLKKSDTQIEWTLEMFEEIEKCAADPIYFAEKYIKIVHVDRGLIPIVLYDYQKDIINNALGNRRSVVLTARQAGKCVHANTNIKIQNKRTLETLDITLSDLFRKFVDDNHRPTNFNSDKFVMSFQIYDYNIYTDTGWRGISHIHKTIQYREWVIKTSSEKTLTCADDHILFDHNYNQIFVKDIIPNYTMIITKNGPELVKSVIETDNYSNMYDVTVDDTNHRLYTNGILSHNTTSAVVIILHYVLFNEYKEVGILANKEAGAAEVLSRVKLAYESLPIWLQQGVVEWNKRSIELENGCKVYTGATTSSSLRGKSLAFLYVDEAAFIEGYDDFFSSVYPTISSGESSKLLLTSTPNGLNHFHKVWTKAVRKENGYAYTFVKWDMVPGRDEAWKKETLDALNHDLDKFAQEYEGEFLGSSGTLISGSTLKTLVEQIPIHKNEDLGLYTYKAPEKDHIYTCIVDVSRGKGLDYSAFSIIDTTSVPYHQVAAFRNNQLNTFDYAEVIHRIATSYNQAFTLIEINDIGQEVANMLTNDFEYENIFYTTTTGKSGKKLSAGFGGASQEKGIRTTKTVKNIGCSMIKTLVEQKQLIVNDENTIDEMKCFSKKGTSYAAESGKNDDMMMGLVLFGWLTTQPLFKEITDTNTLMKFKQMSQEQILEDLMPFGFTYDDLDSADVVNVKTSHGMNDLSGWTPGWLQEDF